MILIQLFVLISQHLILIETVNYFSIKNQLQTIKVTTSKKGQGKGKLFFYVFYKLCIEILIVRFLTANLTLIKEGFEIILLLLPMTVIKKIIFGNFSRF